MIATLAFIESMTKSSRVVRFPFLPCFS